MNPEEVNGGSLITSDEGRTILREVQRLANAVLEVSQQIGVLLGEHAHFRVETKAAIARLHEKLIQHDERFDAHRQELKSIPEDLEVTANRVVKLHEGKRAIEASAAWGKMVRNIVGTVVAGIVIAVIVFMAGRLTK